MTAQARMVRRLQERFGQSIDDAMETWLARLGTADTFSGMMRYQLGWVDEQLRPSRVGGGKRFRPALCLLACESVGGRWQNALPVAAGVELLHNFSLIHDDIEDRDPARRHRPTVWKVWGEPQAINAGDGMFALATRAVAETEREPEVVLDLVIRFQQMALALTRGQYLDMSFESRQDVMVAEYLEMISLKSAALVRYCAWAGGRVAGASPATAARLAAFGDDLGRAFQIADDVLGIWGAPERTGKEPATDVRNHKKTLPVLLALEAADGATRDALRRFYAGTDGELGPVLDALEATDARRRALAELDEYRRRALRSLDGIGLAPEGLDTLQQLVFELTQP